MDRSAYLRSVYAAYPTGVAAVAALVDGAPAGIAASSFVPVSLDPPLVAISFAHSSTTWPRLRACAALGISILAAEQSCVCRQLATRGGDKFDGVSWRATDDGAVLVNAAAAWLDCSIAQEIRAGDHDLVVFAVRDLAARDGADPLVFHGSTYRSLS